MNRTTATLLVVGAAVLAGVTQLLAEAVGGDITVPAQPGTAETVALPLVLTALVAALAAIAGLGATWLLARRTNRAVTIARSLGALVLVVSVVPIAASWTDLPNPGGLVALHLVVGAVVLLGLPVAVGGVSRGG